MFFFGHRASCRASLGTPPPPPIYHAVARLAAHRSLRSAHHRSTRRVRLRRWEYPKVNHVPNPSVNPNGFGIALHTWKELPSDMVISCVFSLRSALAI